MGFQTILEERKTILICTRRILTACSFDSIEYNLPD
jgi:hypothetical protein